MNLNDFAKQITLEEGGKKSLSIAQVKEVSKLVLRSLSKLPFQDVADLLVRIQKGEE